MNRLGQLLLLMILVPAAGRAAPGVELLLPADHVSTSVPYIHIVGRAAASLVVIELNGEVVASPAVRDSVFHTRLSLPFGLNRIKVWPGLGGETDSSLTAHLEVLCGPRISLAYSQLYAPHEFHGRNSPQACLGCHRRDLTPASTEEAGLAWCVSCHQTTGRSFKKHLASASGNCTSCHNIADDLTRTVTGKYEDMNPCFGCHSDKIGQFAQDYIHGPVAGGTCTICHNPHGSDYDNNLRSPVPFLCMFCHTAMEEVQARVKHKPFAEGHCTKCHDPHSTGNRWVLVKSSGEICLSCHEGKLNNHLHRYEVKPRKELEKDLALNDQGRLECLTCHSPHATNSEHLLKTDAANPCVGCHPGHL